MCLQCGSWFQIEPSQQHCHTASLWLPTLPKTLPCITASIPLINTEEDHQIFWRVLSFLLLDASRCVGQSGFTMKSVFVSLWHFSNTWGPSDMIWCTPYLVFVTAAFRDCFFSMLSFKQVWLMYDAVYVCVIKVTKACALYVYKWLIGDYIILVRFLSHCIGYNRGLSPTLCGTTAAFKFNLSWTKPRKGFWMHMVYFSGSTFSCLW